jgi:hypothetical protein
LRIGGNYDPEQANLKWPVQLDARAGRSRKTTRSDIAVGTRRGVRRTGRARTAPRAARPRSGHRHSFQRYLATEFQPDKAALRTAAERYLADTTAEAAAALAQAADPPRQELLRRMNMAPGGTGALIAMRSELTAHLHDEPELKLLDADLRHLLE